MHEETINPKCFTLIGPQGCGKSSFIRFLNPKQLTPYFTEGLNIHWESKQPLCRNLIIHLEEVAAYSKDEIKLLENEFFTTDSLQYRKPYEAVSNLHPRTASFFGSTNQLDFSGDVAHWTCFTVSSIHPAYVEDIDIRQVWAQAYALFVPQVV